MVNPDDLLYLIPLFVSAFLGSWIQDFIITFSPKGTQARFFTRSARVFIGAILSTALVGLGGEALFPTLDWKVTILSSFVLGFLGFRIANIFSRTTAGLDLIGLKNMGDAIKLAEIEMDDKDEVPQLIPRGDKGEPIKKPRTRVRKDNI